MRLGLFLTTVIGLAGASHIASAADASWVAYSQTGNRATCYGPHRPFVTWQVDIKGDALIFTPRVAVPYTYTVDLKGLRPDGSGKAVGKDERGLDFYVTFDPGSGARAFYVTSFESPCRADFTPQR
jgi:hypothetical protein